MISHPKVQGPPTALPDISFQALFPHIKNVLSINPIEATAGKIG